MDKNFLKLINQKKEFEKNGKMFPLEKEKELAIYRTQISDHFRWEQKDEFIETMVNLLENKINLNKYIDQFYQIQNHINQSKNSLHSNLDKLATFEVDPRSKGFSGLIENLFSDIRTFEPDDNLRTEDEISEESLRKGVKEFLSKIQKY